MLNYKGIFYNQEKDKKFFEGGAHFKYSDLVNVLIDLIKEKNKNSESDISKIPSDELRSTINKNILNEESNSSKISKEKKINSNFLTLNNYKIQNNIKIINTHRYVLNTDKNIEKEKARKKKLIELLNFNIKISPFKNNYNNSKKIFCNNSLNRKGLKTLSNNDNLNNSNNYLNTHILNKRIDNNNLPLIQSSYFNNISNNNMVKKQNEINNNNKDSMINLKHVSKFTLNKTKIPKDNLFLKNKIFSPVKNVNNNRKNIFSHDFSEPNKNGSNYGTINILTKRNRFFNPGKLAKYLSNKQKKYE